MRQLTESPQFDFSPAVKSPAVKGRSARRRAAPRWVRPALWCGAAGFVAALVAASVMWLWSSGRAMGAFDLARVALVDASAAAGLSVREVAVTGRDRVSRAAVLEAIAIERGTPLLALDPAAARRRLEALGWVREATVERRFPATVLVRLTERTPLALWQRQGRLVVVDREGVVIGGARPEHFASLPVMVGDDAPAHAANLLAVMGAEPTLRARVRAAVRVGGRRWNVRLDNGIDVLLPEQGVAEAWRRLAEYERRHRLLERAIVAVDLRLPDRLVVRRAPPADDRDDRGGNGRRT